MARIAKFDPAMRIAEAKYEDVYKEADANLTVATDVTVAQTGTGGKFEQLGTPSVGTITLTDTIDPKAADFSAAVTKMKDAAPDVIFYGGYYAEAAKLSTQLRDAGVTSQLVFGDGVKDQAGFVVNALLFPYLNNAIKLFESGVATKEGIDIAMNRLYGLTNSYVSFTPLVVTQNLPDFLQPHVRRLDEAVVVQDLLDRHHLALGDFRAGETESAGGRGMRSNRRSGDTGRQDRAGKQFVHGILRFAMCRK